METASTDIALSQAKRKLLVSIGLFGSLLVTGTFGYYLIGDGSRSLVDCFYFTLVVLTTLGMEGPASQGERYFSILLMLVGIFMLAAAASHLVAFAVDGELNRHLGRRKLEKKIAGMEGHFIVVGFGRMGRALCEQMFERNEPFVLIERDAAKAEAAMDMQMICIQGDATDEAVLRASGIERASGLATCLPNDPANVFVTLTARGIRPYMDIVARAEEPATEPKLLKAGATRVICPPLVGARRLHEMLIKPPVTDLIPATSAEADVLDVCSFRVDALPKLLGKTLAEVDILSQTGMTVAAVERRGKRTFNPPDTFALSDTDKVFVIGPDGGMDRLIKAYSADDRPRRRLRARY